MDISNALPKISSVVPESARQLGDESQRDMQGIHTGSGAPEQPDVRAEVELAAGVLRCDSCVSFGSSSRDSVMVLRVPHPHQQLPLP